MMTNIVVAVVVFVAVLTNTVAGFGIALVAMPFLVQLVGIDVSRPLMSLIAMLTGTLMLLYYRREVTLKNVWPLVITSLIGVPVGELLLRVLDERVVTSFLGLLIIVYALYGLFGPKIPEIKHEMWSWFYGFTSGVLSGAYNTGGPPLVIYANGRRWPPEAFKGNLQGVGFIKGLGVLVTHVVSGNFTPIVWQNFWVGVPAVLLGAVLGFAVAERINPDAFRKVVLVVLILVGVRLMV